MKRHLICLVGVSAVLAFAMAPSVVEAALATALLHKDTDLSTIDLLEDDDWEQLSGNDFIVDEGDFLAGIWQVTGVNSDAYGKPGQNGVEYFTAFFVVEVLKKYNPSTGVYYFGFGPAGKTAFNDFTGVTPNDDDTVALMYSDPDGIDHTSPNFSEVGGTWLWEWGFTGGTPSYPDLTSGNMDWANMPAEVWLAKTNSDDIQDIDAASELFYWAAFNVTDENLSALNGIELLSFTQKLSDDLGNRTAQVFLDGANDKSTVPSATNPWLGTDTNIYINSTPEPSTWIALLGLALMGLIWRWRRSK